MCEVRFVVSFKSTPKRITLKIFDNLINALLVLLIEFSPLVHMQGAEKDLDKAAEAYRRAQLQQNSQAMFNLGYMYEHGLGLPKDLHLAKRYYDQALDTEPAAMLPVTFALIGLYLQRKYGGSYVVSI
jgi:tetratricopeptide (TPR) repeat protein